MADFFSKFKRKTRGSSSGSSDNDSCTTREKLFCESLAEDIIPTEEVDEVVLALDMSSEVASTLHQVLEKLKIMEKKVDGVLEKVTGLECTMKTVQDEENTRETVYRFMERELNIEGARHIEFQRVHRIGAKKPGNSRPIIARFLKYPDRERVFKRALERRGHIDVKIYSDLPREIQEGRKKQWPLLKRAREERKTAFFSKK